jgi:hypothetical protein
MSAAAHGMMTANRTRFFPSRRHAPRSYTPSRMSAATRTFDLREWLRSNATVRKAEPGKGRGWSSASSLRMGTSR